MPEWLEETLKVGVLAILLYFTIVLAFVL